MRKQSHQNTHQTFTCRKDRVFYFGFHVQRLEPDEPDSDPLCLVLFSKTVVNGVLYSFCIRTKLLR